MQRFFRSATRGFLLLPAVLVSILFLAGCDVRPISASGYGGGGYYVRGNPLYEGELTEFDVLGIDPSRTAPQEEIEQALARSRDVRIQKGASVMLIQSGALFPDEPMQAALGRHFNIVPFSGIPLTAGPARDPLGLNYGNPYQQAAARSGVETLVCYWGILETARKDLSSSAVSWIPVAGWAVPDRTQVMRIRLKFAVVDVKTGSWALFLPEPMDHEAVSAIFNRERRDQEQVALLKEKAYPKAAADLVRAFVD